DSRKHANRQDATRDTSRSVVMKGSRREGVHNAAICQFESVEEQPYPTIFAHGFTLHEIHAANEPGAGRNDPPTTSLPKVVNPVADCIADLGRFCCYSSLKFDPDGLTCGDDLRVQGGRLNQQKNEEKNHESA